jgi:hypothetical protein
VRFSSRYLCFDEAEPMGRRRALLWPVLVWHVIYPTPVRSALNIFQKTILRLARSGCVSSKDQALMMGLSSDLVAFIAEKELGAQQLLDSSGRPTPKGVAAIQGDEDADKDLRIGYVFQDAVTGALMPRFSEGLPEIEAEEDGPEAWPRFVLSRATGREIRPFCVLGHRQHPPPTSQSLLDAYHTYRFHYRQREVGEVVDSDQSPSKVNLRGIEAIGAEPQAMQLLIWVQAAEADGWRVRDPFNVLEFAPWLRQSVEVALPVASGLGKYLEAVLASDLRSNSSEGQSAELTARVELEMLSRPWVLAAPEVAEQMEIVLRRSYQISATPSPLPEDLNSLAIETQKLGEAALKWCLRRWPVDRRRLPRREEMLSMSVAWWLDFYANLGLPCLTQGAIQRLAQQKWADVETALKSGKRSLKALTAAGVLSSIEHLDHPFRRFTAEELALETLFQMADERNAAGHFSGELPSAEAVGEASRFVVRWTDLLIEAGRNG